MTPKFRQVLYAIGTVAFAALTVLATFKVIDPNTAASVSAALTAVFGLFGVSLSGVAAYHTTKQINGGTYDPTPAPAPEDQVITGLNGVLAQKAAAEAAVEKVKDALGTAVGQIPVLGPLAQQAIDSLPG